MSELVPPSPELQNFLSGAADQLQPPSSSLQNFISSDLAEEKYGSGVINPLKAAALGAANSASFGMIPRGLIKSGILSKETAKGLEEHNPIATGVGEVAGVIGSMALAPEAGIATEVRNGLAAAKEFGTAAKVAEYNSALQSAKNIFTAGDIANPVSALSKIAGQVGEESGSRIAQGAIEGLGFAAGNINYEHALGDPTLNAQKVYSELGWGAVLGGGLNALFGVGEKYIPKAYTAAEDAMTGLRDWSLGSEATPGGPLKAYSKVSSFFSGKPEEDIIGGVLNRAERAATPEEFQKTVQETKNKIQDVVDKNASALKEVNAKLRGIETESLIPPESSVKANEEMQRVISKMNIGISSIKDNPEMYDQGLIKEIELQKDALIRSLKKEGDLGATGPEIFKALDEAKGKIQKLSDFDKTSNSKQQLTKDMIVKSIGREIRQGLENEAIWGEAGARQAAFNEAQSKFIQSSKYMKKLFSSKELSEGGERFLVNDAKVERFLKQLPTKLDTPQRRVFTNYINSANQMLEQVGKSHDSVAAGGLNLSEALTKSKNLKEVAEEANKLVGTHIKDIKDLYKRQQYAKRLGSGKFASVEIGLASALAHSMGASGSVAYPAIAAYETLKNPSLAIRNLSKIEGLIGKANRAIKNTADFAVSSSGTIRKASTATILERGSEDKKSKEDKLSEFKRVSAKLHFLSQDPNQLADHLNKATESLYAAAPNIARDVNSSAMVGFEFLSSKMPMQKLKTLVAEEFVPSGAQVDKFLKYYSAVEKPLSVLRGVGDGSISVEGVEALRSVYPDLYTDLQKAVIDKVSTLKEKPSYQRRLSLSMFMGADLDSTIVPSMIAANQMSFNMQRSGNSAQQDNKVKPTTKALSNINLASRSVTPQNKSEQRAEERSV